MKLTDVEMNRTGQCPVCSAAIGCGADVEEAEVLTCPDCHSALVVESVNGGFLALGKAPQAEEDWGE